MKIDVNSSSEGPDPEVIVTFGGARLVKILGKVKRLEVQGGTAEEQRQAWEWAGWFLKPTRGTRPKFTVFRKFDCSAKIS